MTTKKMDWKIMKRPIKAKRQTFFKKKIKKYEIKNQ